MKNYKSLFVGISFFIMLLVSQPATGETFSIKGWQAAIISEALTFRAWLSGRSGGMPKNIATGSGMAKQK
jgi:hypothetical protein